MCYVTYLDMCCRCLYNILHSSVNVSIVRIEVDDNFHETWFDPPMMQLLFNKYTICA